MAENLSIHMIYRLFDKDTERLVQRAMRLCGGNVLQIEDLVAALYDAIPDLASRVLPNSRPSPRRKGSQAGMPLENSSMVRLALQRASELARCQTAGLSITPKVLLASVALVLARSSDYVEVLAALDLRYPKSLLPEEDGDDQRVLSPRELGELFSKSSFADAILDRWMVASQLPPGESRDVLLRRLRLLAQRHQTTKRPVARG